MVFPLISSGYIARVILPAGVGQVSYAQNIVSYFTVFAALGIPIYGVRVISQSRDDKEQLNRRFSELIILNGISTTICLLLYLLLLILLFKENISLYLICGILIIFNYINIDWFYQGIEDYAYIAIRSSIIKTISMICLFIFVKTPADICKYALITVLAAGGNYIFNIIHAVGYVSIRLKNLDLARHLKPILFLMASFLASELYTKVDVTMLGYTGVNEAVGYYTNSLNIVNMLITLPTAVTAIFLPRISYYYKTNRKKYEKLINKGVEILFFLILPCFVGIELVSDYAIPVLFGQAFLPAAKTLRLLAPLILIKGFGDLLCYQVVISSDNERMLWLPYTLTALINMMLNVILIPRYLQDGAAIATVISELLLNLILYCFVTKKVIRIQIDLRENIKIIVAAMLMVCMVILVQRLHLNMLFSLILQILSGGFIYLICNLIIGSRICTVFIKYFLKIEK